MLQALNVCNFDIFLPLLLQNIAEYRGFHKSLFEVLVRGTYGTFSVVRLWMQLEGIEIFSGWVHECEGGIQGRVMGAYDLHFLQDRQFLCWQKSPMLSV